MNDKNGSIFKNALYIFFLLLLLQSCELYLCGGRFLDRKQNFHETLFAAGQRCPHRAWLAS